MATDESPGETSDPVPEAGDPGEEFLRARHAVYSLLAAVFDGDVERLTDAMADGSFERLAAALPVDLDTAPLVQDDPDAEALNIGYDNLFVVPGPHFVPPFASAHATDPSHEFDSDSAFHDADTAGELYGDPAARMARRYERVDFSPASGDGVPDHLAAQLSFLATLAGHRAEVNEPELREALFQLERETLADMNWLDAFDDAVAERDTREGVFATLARLTRCVVAWDAKRSTSP